MSQQHPFRSIAPGPAPAEAATSSSLSRSRKVSTACQACKISRRKCSGTRPCDACHERDQDCIFDETLDQRRHVAAKRNVAELEYYRDILNDLFHLVQSSAEAQVLQLVELIRSDATLEQVREHIDSVSAAASSSSVDPAATALTTTTTTTTTTPAKRQREHSVGRHGRGRRRSSHGAPKTTAAVQRASSLPVTRHSFRNKVMDVNFLSDTPPINVPASPWTTVTDDDDIVSHLVSLYFTWDDLFSSFLDRHVFVKHMAAGVLDSRFCSPFLVNSMLAHACHQSEFAEAYEMPGNELTKGNHFQKEAERLWQGEEGKCTLPNLQASLLIHERYSLFGRGDLGYIWLNRAIEIGLRMGLVDEDGDVMMATANQSNDMETASRHAAWGLYQIDTRVHAEFLQPNRISNIRLPRPDMERTSTPLEEDDRSPWQPYPMRRDPRPEYAARSSDEACNLSEISGAISRSLFQDEEYTQGDAVVRSMKDDFSKRLQIWHEKLPGYFDRGATLTPAPHILLLHMRYYALLINVFAAHAEPRGLPSEWPSDDREIALSSARSIADLARIHRREYGISRAHYFILYAVNLALFVFLQSFNGTTNLHLPDADFTSLTNAFFIIASRSALGRTMLHSFERNLRSNFSRRELMGMNLSRELRSMLTSNICANCNADLSGLSDMEESDRYPFVRGPENQAGIGVKEMLHQYEALSLGRNDQQTRREAAQGLEES